MICFVLRPRPFASGSRAARYYEDFVQKPTGGMTYPGTEILPLDDEARGKPKLTCVNGVPRVFAQRLPDHSVDEDGPMSFKDILVHVDSTPASRARLSLLRPWPIALVGTSVDFT